MFPALHHGDLSALQLVATELKPDDQFSVVRRLSVALLKNIVGKIVFEIRRFTTCRAGKVFLASPSTPHEPNRNPCRAQL
ncbi:MAG: hypothetical protein ACRC1K_16860 [Planctomycetia bacterium]